MHAIAFRLALTIVGTIAMAGLPRAATADVVTGTVTPADATVIVVDASAMVAALVVEGDHASALRDRLRGERLQAPHLIDIEVGPSAPTGAIGLRLGTGFNATAPAFLTVKGQGA